MCENSVRLDSIEKAIADIAAGKAVVVVDDEDRENEGDLIFAAEKATPELVAFMVKYSSGYVCVALEPQDCERLNLPPMVAKNQDARGTAYAVTVDLANGSTGISAADRSATITALAEANSQASAFTRPGHVVPLSAVPGGVLAREGHTEASVDLARLAGLRPAGVLCEVVSEIDPTGMARSEELRDFADRHGLAMISIEQLRTWRLKSEQNISREAVVKLPTSYGDFAGLGYVNPLDGTEHMAVVAGEVDALRGATDVMVRIHSECLTGDVFGSQRCECGPQLQASLEQISQAGRGVVIYLRGHEGRGIGLTNKLKAYELQETGLDTVDANVELGLPVDAREFYVAAQIIKDLGISSVRLLTNNPAKVSAMEDLGVKISSQQALEITPLPSNLGYLTTKRDKMGHTLSHLEAPSTEAGNKGV